MPLLLALLAALSVLAGCGGGEEAAPAGEALVREEGLEHVHGLGLDPADGALLVATHTGLWRAPEGGTAAERVGDVRHDLMGFTVVGAGDFLASGHPAPGTSLPPLLGLQRSTDGGRSWSAVSLLGEADLHVLRAAGRRVYGVDASTGRLLASADAGRTFAERSPPSAVVDLAVHPDDDERLVAATPEGLFGSADTGRTWRRLGPHPPGLLAWPAPGALLHVGGDGTVSRSGDGGRTLTRTGTLGAMPQALLVPGPDELLVAVDGGEVRRSADAGATWQVRVAP